MALFTNNAILYCGCSHHQFNGCCVAVDRRCAEWRLSRNLDLCTPDAESTLKRKRDAAEQPYAQLLRCMYRLCHYPAEAVKQPGIAASIFQACDTCRQPSSVKSRRHAQKALSVELVCPVFLRGLPCPDPLHLLLSCHLTISV